MAQGLGGVFMTDTNGNIGVANVENAERVSGLLFDISGQGAGFWTSGAGVEAAATFQNAVVELNTIDDATEGGIESFNSLTGETAATFLLNGVAYYHIRHYFNSVGGSGRLFVMFADCSTGFQDALVAMQGAAKGMISQFGIWTEQPIWGAGETYTVAEWVTGLNGTATLLANQYHAPCVITVAGNSAQVGGSNDVNLAKIPSVGAIGRYVAVLLGQGKNETVAAIQNSLTSKTPVGTVGCVIGQLANSNVAESIGWVEQHNVVAYFGDIEMGFGGNNTPFSALTFTQIDALADKGYIFLCRYAGIENGIYFSGDNTGDEKGDYRTLSRNRVINKSRRVVRTALLPYVNAPIKLAPSTGTLSAAQITVFRNAIQGGLEGMANANEISGIGVINIPAGQNILVDDTLNVSYSLVPMGTSKRLEVTEGFVLNS